MDSPAMITMSSRNPATHSLRFADVLSSNFIFGIQAFSVKLGLTENFPSSVHHQSRLGTMLGHNQTQTSKNILSFSTLAPLVRALEIATEKSSLDPNLPDSGMSSLTPNSSVTSSPRPSVKCR